MPSPAAAFNFCRCIRAFSLIVSKPPSWVLGAPPSVCEGGSLFPDSSLPHGLALHQLPLTAFCVVPQFLFLRSRNIRKGLPIFRRASFHFAKAPRKLRIRMLQRNLRINLQE